ncbi:hypothetical protein DFH09DRAFT_1449247 [Mycena vulgaris]|nr:hypothetical protein DFH09DRAFT_1449247 [Mycena vulgaris]
MADVQAHTTRLIALFVSCVLYGILLMTFIPSIRSLLCSASQKFQFKRRADIKFPATSMMFLVSSVSVVLSLQSVINAFIDYKGPGGALEFYDTVNAGWKHWIVAIEDAVQVITGDGLLIYRCYVIYDRNWCVIILPGISWLAMTALSITSSYYDAAVPSATGKRLNGHNIIPVLSDTLLLTFTTSVITTYLITHFLTRVAMVFFETGMIYTLSVIVALGVYLSWSNLKYVATLTLIHIIPITCNLLLIRVEGVNRFGPHGNPSNRSRSTPSSQPSATEGKFNSKVMEEV